MNTAHPLAATLAQIHRLSLDGTLAEITPLAESALALLEKTRADVPELPQEAMEAGRSAAMDAGCDYITPREAAAAYFAIREYESTLSPVFKKESTND